jgi:hypothetical protein
MLDYSFFGTCWIVLVGDPVRKAIPPIDYKNPKLGKWSQNKKGLYFVPKVITWGDII